VVHALVVAAAVIDALASLGLHYPKVGKDKLKNSRRRRRNCLANGEPGDVAMRLSNQCLPALTATGRNV
jgi:hypothetical protein